MTSLERQLAKNFEVVLEVFNLYDILGSNLGYQKILHVLAYNGFFYLWLLGDYDKLDVLIFCNCHYVSCFIYGC